MIRMCCLCGRVLGHKEPYEDNRISHDLCRDCAALPVEEYTKRVLEVHKKREERNGNT